MMKFTAWKDVVVGTLSVMFVAAALTGCDSESVQQAAPLNSPPYSAPEPVVETKPVGGGYGGGSYNGGTSIDLGEAERLKVDPKLLNPEPLELDWKPEPVALPR